MLKSSKKYLIASADSMGVDLITHTKNLNNLKEDIAVRWTELDKIGDPFPVWPDLVAEKLNLEAINLSVPGIGNRAIYERAINEISRHNPKNIGLVVLMWSEWTRIDIRVPRYANYFRVRGRDRVNEILFKESLYGKLNKLQTYEYIKMIVELNLMYFYLMQNFLENLGIKYIMFSGLNPVKDDMHIEKIGVELDDSHEKYLLKNITESHYLELIDTSKFIGFPGHYKKGYGFSWDNCLAKLDPEKTLTRLGNQFKNIGKPFDMHPNEYGHKIGSDIIYEHYQKTFQA
mgnify:CR=1 FL=1